MRSVRVAAPWVPASSHQSLSKKKLREPRSVAQLVEHRSPKPGAGGSSPSTPAIIKSNKNNGMKTLSLYQGRGFFLKKSPAWYENGTKVYAKVNKTCWIT